ncbi:hypothetical protein PCANC_19444 [Puccinia coronata f. sp. avenae]|uniref:Kinesin motor domain-containing protein n=1 Tax=Puccinia coronata f. sp. avenae TaxID=200324 RepID=A0A2N5UF08_9BASI|nr:hypothetical protein PCANC_19444 [Puccinia coronata f. sp. avenae]
MPSREHSQAHTPHRKRDSHSSDNPSIPQTENVSVCVRIRPIPSSPLSDIDLDTPTPQHRQSSPNQNPNRFGAWSIDPTQSSISLSPSHPIIDRRGTGTSESVNGSEGYEFKLDQIFDPYSTTGHLYRSSVQSVVESCIKDGYNATVFAYGQTGSGKTFTMLSLKDVGDDETLGVIPRAVAEVFAFIASDLEREYLLRVSYLEIYNEALKDLLAADQSSATTNRLTIHENTKGRVHVNGIKEEVVTHPMQVLEVLTRGEKARHVGATDWNERSSRSHTVFTMTIESRPKSSATTTETSPTQISQLNLIDLAGSESAASSTERRKEGAFINKSLLALSNVISKLSKREAHIPYRDSKLTRLLQTSLSGNAKVVVICAISADARSVVETLSTLRFARRAKMVVTKAERGTIIDDKSALLQAYQREIMSLKSQLQQNSQALSITTTSVPALAELNAEKSKAESELMGLRLERIRLEEQIEHLNRRILTSHTIESNVRRANSLQVSASPPRRRIVSGQLLRPPKKNKGRVTDVGGMLGMLGIGLSSSTTAFLPNGSTLNEDNRAQFQRELKLEKELENLRQELDRLKQQRSQSPEQLSPSGLDLLKQQIQALESDKENLPVGLNEETEQARKIKTLEDQIETMDFEYRQTVESNKAEIESLKRTINLSEEAKQAELEELEQRLIRNFQEQEEKLKKAHDELEDTSRLKLSEAQEEMLAVKAEIEANQGRIKELETRIEDTQSQNLEKRLESLQIEYDQLKLTNDDSIQCNQSQVATLESQLSSIQKEKEEVDSHSREMQDLISKLELEVISLRKEKEEAIAAQQEQITRLELEKSDIQAKLNQLESDLEINLASSKEESVQLMSEQRDQIVKLEAEKLENQQRFDDTQSQLTSELTTCRKEIEDLSVARQQQQQESEDMITKLEKEKSEAQVQAEELQAKLKELQAELEALQAKLAVDSVSLRKENDEILSTQQEQIAQLETEKGNLLTQVEELKTQLETETKSLREKCEDDVSTKEAIAAEAKDDGTELIVAHVPEEEPDQEMVGRIAELETELSEAQQKINNLTLLKDEKEELVQTLQSRISILEVELSEVGAKVEELVVGKVTAEETVKKVETDNIEQVKILEAEMMDLKTALENERTARLTDSEKVKNLEEEVASLCTLQKDTSSVTTKLEKLEQRLTTERSKFQDKELEVMQLIQERDQAQGNVARLESLLDEQTVQAEEDVKSIINKQAESQSDLEELRHANEAKEKDLEISRSETERLKVELEKMKIERTNQEIQQEKLERLSSRFQDDLRKMQEREQDLMEKIDSSVREKCEATSSKLHQDYNSKLAHLEDNNSKLEAHIKGLESHLATVSSGQRQQTTAESMETIVDLQSTIEDQNREIGNLRTEIENLKKSAIAHPLESRSRKRSEHDHYHQSTEDELNRLYHIIDQQEKRLSDAKTDLSKWQARVRSQTEIISKLKISPESDSELPSKSRGAPERRSTAASDHFSGSSISTPNITFNNLSHHPTTIKPAGLSPLLGGGHHSHTTWQSNHRHTLSSTASSFAPDNRSPRPLPVPQSFIASIDDDDLKRRKERRRTIENDMAKLKNESVVERKLNSLLSSPNLKALPHLSQESQAKPPISPLQLSSSNRFKVPSSPLLSSHPVSSTNMSRNHSRQSGQTSPAASSFSCSSQRGYYE